MLLSVRCGIKYWQTRGVSHYSINITKLSLNIRISADTQYSLLSVAAISVDLESHQLLPKFVRWKLNSPQKHSEILYFWVQQIAPQLRSFTKWLSMLTHAFLLRRGCLARSRLIGRRSGTLAGRLQSKNAQIIKITKMHAKLVCIRDSILQDSLRIGRLLNVSRR